MTMTAAQRAGIALLVLALALPAAPAWAAASAAATGMGSGREGTFIVEIVLLLLVGRLLGEGMQRIGQPAIMGQLIAGILLGPSVFGALAPDLQRAVFPSAPEQKAMINAVSQLGILMLLLLTGMETDLKLVRRVGGASIAVSLTGILIPFACGFAAGQLMPASLLPEAAGRLVPSLFLGTALSISSVKIVALIVREMNFLRRDLGQIIVASAIIEDTIGWIIIAITFGIAAHGKLDLLSLAKTVVGIALFLGVSFTVGRRVVFDLIRWSNDTFRSEFPVITMILIIMGVMAEITQLLGVQTVLGAFVAGILIGESPILTAHVEDELRGLITALFMPVFFGLAGLGADLTVLKDPHLALLTAALVAIASIGKFSGAFLGGTIGGLNLRQSVAVGSAMNARGSTEVIVATIGLSMGMLSRNLFTMIVTMAVITTTLMPPMLRRALARIPPDEDEKKRVEREILDEKGFVSRFERLLLAVDDSDCGKFTSRLAGLVAGAQGLPITIVHMKDEPQSRDAPDGPSRQVKEGAKKSAAKVEHDAEKPDKVHLTTRVATDDQELAIREEARKGFDLMMIGLESASDAAGVFNDRLSRLATGFEGPLAIVSAAQSLPVPRLDTRAQILVPIDGGRPARNAAEVAFAVARPTGARVTALYVASGANTRMRDATRAGEELALKDIAELGERYGVRLRTALETRSDPDSAIARYATREKVDMIVMGVTPHTGDVLYFGKPAASLLTRWKGALLFLAS